MENSTNICDAEVTDQRSAPEGLGLPEGVPPLRAFYLYMTTGCNLCCRHCWITPTFVDGEPSPGKFISLELLRQAVSEAKPLGLCSVKLTGGEPLIHPEFREIALFLQQQGIRVDMESNGTLIDAPMARFLHDEASVWFVSVSLDSIDPAKHDDFRGVRGSYDAALRGIKNLVGAGYRPQVIMSPHRGNVNEVESMVHLAEELNAGSVKFNPVTNAGRGRQMHEHGEALEYEEYRQLLRFVNGDLQSRSRLRLAISAPPALLTADDLLHNRWRGVCNVANIMGLLGSGDMALCGIGSSVPALRYGRLVEDTLRDVWESAPLLHEIRKGLLGPFPGICDDCIHASFCRTGCLAMNYMDSGKLFAPSPWCEEAAHRGEFPQTRRKSWTPDLS
jgi:SynChlorMet cassette radical SAM/SPASM protein ScmF